MSKRSGTPMYVQFRLSDVSSMFPKQYFIIIIISPFIARVVGAPQMISQPVFSISPCSPLPSGTWKTPGLSIPWCCLPTSSSVCLVFFPLSMCLARWFWPNLMKNLYIYDFYIYDFCIYYFYSEFLYAFRKQWQIFKTAEKRNHQD